MILFHIRIFWCRLYYTSACESQVHGSYVRMSHLDCSVDQVGQQVYQQVCQQV